MKILFAASECVPFCKTGGLADVVGALPKELKRRRQDVRIILPKYKSIRTQEFNITPTGKVLRIPMGHRVEEAELHSTVTEHGVRVYFIHHEGYFGRPGLYRNNAGDYEDNAERFIFFSRAVLEACKAVRFCPEIVHTHDWQTGLIPAYLKTLYRTDAFFQHTASVFTIHNIAYQGTFTKELMPLTGFTWAEFTMDKLEFYDQISFLKAGLTYSDGITTVSPTYAQEIQSSARFGMGMEGTLRARSGALIGILNGLDVEEWDPSRDPFLPKDYDAHSLERRRDCKAYLQESLGLPVHAGQPLLGVVARLDQQKGIDLLLEIIPGLVQSGVQIVILGQGDPGLQEKLAWSQAQFPLNVRLRTDFNEPLAHHIYAGCDIFVMPSRFEPCGLSQMIAMRYGAIPVVAGTGGLLDTVMPMGPHNRGNGFIFYEPTAHALWDAIQHALSLYANSNSWIKVQEQAMAVDFSWEGSAMAYLHAYRQSLGRHERSRQSLKRR